MNAPARTQVKVLRTLQNQTVWLNNAVATATERERQTGQSPPQSWYAAARSCTKN
ncbi:hypothetical protein ACIBCD_15140 [Nocardia brasiliensis]|uniref:hypothetical protein n=1 Tax=Nocardia brasiliensis TaxID=37326 RepID=UPI000B2DD365|nr:hypothetical protein [Nocardia brasiliensis]